MIYKTMCMCTCLSGPSAGESVSRSRFSTGRAATSFCFLHKQHDQSDYIHVHMCSYTNNTTSQIYIHMCSYTTSQTYMYAPMCSYTNNTTSQIYIHVFLHKQHNQSDIHTHVFLHKQHNQSDSQKYISMTMC